MIDQAPEPTSRAEVLAAGVLVALVVWAFLAATVALIPPGMVGFTRDDSVYTLASRALLAGKGYVDLMAVYHDADELAAIKTALEQLGFQRQRSRDPWPEDRPMRIGALAHDGTTFLLHFHVISADSPEVARQRAFRDGLRADPALVAAYVARKRAVIAGGVIDGIDYSIAKGSFIEGVLGIERATGEG